MVDNSPLFNAAFKRGNKEIKKQNKELLIKNGIPVKNTTLHFGASDEFVSFSYFMKEVAGLDIHKDLATQELVDKFKQREIIKNNNKKLLEDKNIDYQDFCKFYQSKKLYINVQEITPELLEEYNKDYQAEIKFNEIINAIGKENEEKFYSFLEQKNYSITKDTVLSEVINEFISFSIKNKQDTHFLYDNVNFIINENIDFVTNARLNGFKVEVNIDGEKESILRKSGTYGQLFGESGANLGAMMEPDLKTMKVKCRIAPKGIRLTPWKSNELFDLRIPWETIKQVSTSSKGLLIKSDETTVSFLMKDQAEIKTFWALIVDNTNLTVDDDGW